MNIKQHIRRWLEIETPKAVQPELCDLRKMIGRALQDAVDGKPDFYITWGFPHENWASKFKSLIVVEAQAAGAAAGQQEAERLIYAESFIDSVIDRIKRKQLT